MVLQRFWVSWWSGYYISEGCTEPPFQTWSSGWRDRNDGSGKDDESHCAVIDAPDEDAVWKSVKKHFPDYEERFIRSVENDFIPGDRFPDFENRTRLDE